MFERRGAVAAAILLVLAGSPLLAACDEDPKRSDRTIGKQAPPDAEPQKTEQAQPGPPQKAAPSPPQQATPGPPQQAKPGARPTNPTTVIGTWRVRIKDGADEAQPGITYTFTSDGRVTVGPDQICRYKLENQTLSIDCAGTTAESASGTLERENENRLIWRVKEKTVRLERQDGEKEQQ
jgi:hypothetical protein